MGNICHSHESTAVATARLILEDGQLQEFSQPVKVSHVLRDAPASFVCDSDEMDFGVLVSAVSEDEELQLGQLYFVLPLTCLNRPVRAEQMAALTVKASSALRLRRHGGGGARCCGVKGVEPLEFAVRRDVIRYRRLVVTAGGERRDRRRRRFVVKLGAIDEE